KASMDKRDIEKEAEVFPVRFYTIRAFEEVTPAITSVKGQPSKEEIPHGSTTTENTVIFNGEASKDQQIEIYDGTVPKGKFRVDASGHWITDGIGGLAEGAHSFKAKALYGSEESSTARNFFVAKPFNVDITHLDIYGHDITAPASLGWTRKSNPPGIVRHRTASGGKPPYTYTSDTRTVTVSNNGVITSVSTGNATITVSDSSTPVQTKRFNVTVHGAITLIHNPSLLSRSAAAAWITSQGGSFLDPRFIDGIARNFDANYYPNKSTQWSVGRLQEGSGTQAIGIYPNPYYYYIGGHAAGTDIPCQVIAYR
ncbi:hypothetical protein ACXR0M_27215, partial [Pseudomonas sp. Eth.TT006]